MSYLFHCIVYFFFFLQNYCPLAAVEKKCPHLRDNEGILILILILTTLVAAKEGVSSYLKMNVSHHTTYK